MTTPVEVLLRETLERLYRQEQRTATLEAALLETQPTLLARPSPSLTQTPSPRTEETSVMARPKCEPSDERFARVPKAEPRSPSSALSPFSVLSSLDDVIWSVSPDGQFVLFIGGAVERLYGVSEHELHNDRERWLDALPPDDRDRLRAALARLSDADRFTLEHRVAHAAGGFRWAVTRGTLVRDRDGCPLRVDGITTDVTRQAQIRCAILDILNGIGSATDGDFLVKLTHHLRTACGVRAAVVVEPHPGEPSAARIAAGGESEQATFPATTPLVRELLAGGRAYLPAGARNRYPTEPLLLHLNADAFAAEPLIDASGRLLGFLALADDRPFAPESDPPTLLKSLGPRAAVELARSMEEVTLAQAERRARDAEAVVLAANDLAAAGRIAAGLAHDFNNLLGVVAGNADLIGETLPAADPRRELVETIARTAQSVAGMNRKLLAVGKPGPALVAPLDVATAIRALEPLLQRLAGKRNTLGFDLAPGLPLIAADATQFDRVLINLVLNARDAIETAGTITVRAARAVIEAEHPRGEYVAITVADTGCGIPADVRVKMFDPFFTTKGDRGTGLGLATVREAVSAAGGHIKVESEIGWGTEIRVYWPPLSYGERGA